MVTIAPSPPKTVSVEIIGSCLVIRLNRPQAKNAINVEMLQALAENYTRLSSSPELRSGVLCGEGDTFCAGLDLMDVIPRAISEGRAMYLKERQCDPFGLFGPPCTKPVIAAVHGRCYTAGLELTLAADLCVAETGTVFGQQETTRGIMPLGGGTFRLPRAIGWHNAMNCILAGATFTAEDAHRWGLVQTIAERGRHLDEALKLATAVANCAPLGVQAALRNARLSQSDGDAAAIADIEVSGRVVAQTEDAREGMMSLMQRRKANFLGR